MGSLTICIRSPYLIAAGALLALGLCGCAAIAIEEVGAGEAIAGGAEATAPALTEAAGAEDVVAGSDIFNLWREEGKLPTILAAEDGELPGLYVNGSRYSIDLPSGSIMDTRGIEVARIEGTRIYRVYPTGTHELLAQIETKLDQPVAAYRDATALSRIRMLKSGDLVQVVQAEEGWYQFRFVDEKGNELLLWAFAPALCSRLDGKNGTQPSMPSIFFRTQISRAELKASALNTADKLRNDIDNIFSSK